MAIRAITLPRHTVPGCGWWVCGLTKVSRHTWQCMKEQTKTNYDNNQPALFLRNILLLQWMCQLTRSWHIHCNDGNGGTTDAIHPYCGVCCKQNNKCGAPFVKVLLTLDYIACSGEPRITLLNDACLLQALLSNAKGEIHGRKVSHYGKWNGEISCNISL